MSFSATIPAAQIESANATLDGAGFGPDNFSVPLRTGAADATHAGLHSWDVPGFRAAVAAIPNVQITDGTGLNVTFSSHCAARSLEWSDPTFWFENPVMIGYRRTHGGKEWESLVDYNVWTPPVGWREVVTSGYPAWVQPSGAHDAYVLGFIVTHNGQNGRSDFAANVWEPGVFGWSVVP